MKNKDLRRFFENNPLADETRQFVRYDDDGKLFYDDLKDAGLKIVDVDGQTELVARGKTLSTIENPIRSANLIDPKFIAQSGAYYKHIGPTGQLFAITTNLTNMLPWEGNPQFAPSVGSISMRFICPDGYQYPSSITVTNSNYTWVGGVIVLSNVIGNVTITIVGQKEQPGPTPEGLLAFSVGQTIGSIQIDPEALTNDEMQAWAHSVFDFSSEDTQEVVLVENSEEYALINAIGQRDMGIILQITDLENDQFLIWADRANSMGLGNEGPGWYTLDQSGEEMIVTPVESTMTFTTYELLDVANVDSTFNALNGIVLGVVEMIQGELDQFGIGDEYLGYDFGDAENGQSSDLIDRWLKSLTYTEDQQFAELDTCRLILKQGFPVLFAVNYDEYYILFCLYDEDNLSIVYSTGAGSFELMGQTMSFTKGWQNLIDGKVYLPDGTYKMGVTNVYNYGNWNGNIIGEYEGTHPTPSGLTPFEVGDSIETGDKICFDTSIDDNDLLNFLEGLTYDGEGLCYLVYDSDAPQITAVHINTLYALMCQGSQGLVGWASEAMPEMGVVKGWQGLDQDGKYEMTSNFGKVTGISEAPGWNGIIVGLEKAE